MTPTPDQIDFDQVMTLIANHQISEIEAFERLLKIDVQKREDRGWPEMTPAEVQALHAFLRRRIAR